MGKKKNCKQMQEALQKCTVPGTEKYLFICGMESVQKCTNARIEDN